MTFRYRVCRVARTLARHYADQITQPTASPAAQSMFLQIQFSHLSHSANTATNHQILNLLHAQYIQYSVFLASWQRILFSFASSIQFKISSQSSEGQYRIISSPHHTGSHSLSTPSPHINFHKLLPKWCLFTEHSNGVSGWLVAGVPIKCESVKISQIIQFSRLAFDPCYKLLSILHKILNIPRQSPDGGPSSHRQQVSPTL